MDVCKKLEVDIFKNTTLNPPPCPVNTPSVVSPLYFIQAGSSRLLGVVHPDLGQVIAVSLGKARGLNKQENINLDREAARSAAAAGIRAGVDLGNMQKCSV